MAMAIETGVRDERIPSASRRASAAEVAWVMLFLDGLLLGMSSLFWIFRGRFFDARFYDTVTGGVWPVAAALGPSIERVASAGVRLAGFLGAMASIFVITVAVTAFRKREPWAWYVMLTLPAFAVLDFALVAGYQAVTFTAIAWELALFGLASAALALTSAEFFPRVPRVPRVKQEEAGAY